MEYSLIGSGNIVEGKMVSTILENRGVGNPEKYMSLGSDVLLDPLGLDGMEDAVEMFLKHILNKSRIGIIVDPDVDGYASASILYRYIMEIYEGDARDIVVLMHSGKEHGISDDVEIPMDIDLLISPDGGSNDVEQCRGLSESGIDIIILDHHEVQKANVYAIVVNPNNCEYENKDLSGAGVVYKFMVAVDDAEWTSHSGEYKDLVGLSIISDSMELKGYENKYLVDDGLKNIKNRFLLSLIEKQSYSMKGLVNIINLQFYVNPLINAMIRVGSEENKRMMFDAFAEIESFHPYKKRGSDEEIQQSIFEKMARECVNARAKQNRAVGKHMDLLSEKIEEHGWHKNKVMFVKGEDVEKSFTGLVAMKLAVKYNRPCLLLRRNPQRGTYSGSGRNIDCELTDLREYLVSTGNCWAQGHGNAFGFSISQKLIPETIAKINKDLADLNFTKQKVDFEFGDCELTYEIAMEIANAREYYGNDIKESFIYVETNDLDPSDINVFGSKMNTVKFVVNGVEFVKFRCDENEPIKLLTESETSVTIRVVGKVMLNEYNNDVTPQVYIEEYEVINE